MIEVLIIGIVILTFANGANDNFKGVATVYGSGISKYRGALLWATITTFAGCIASLFIAEKLATMFSGKGIIPQSMIDGRLAISMCLGAGTVILFASFIGMPISTSHAIFGGLVGSALVLQGWQLPWNKVLLTFAVPLAFSPVIAAGLVWLAARIVPSANCVCVAVKPISLGTAPAVPILEINKQSVCEQHGFLKLFTTNKVETGLHFISAGAVGFARGLNDLPKIIGVLLAAKMFDIGGWVVPTLALLMALGGIIGAARVAKTMSCEITPMTDRQGLVANLVTSTLVVAASFAAMPVSTTHVSCGSLAGLGLSTRQLSVRRFGQILFAWLVTLPAAAIVSAIILLLI